MAVNEVIYGDRVLISLTSDTVTAETLAEGVTAHDASGEVITGTMSSNTVSVPGYWQTHLDERVENIRAAFESAGRNKSAFLWYHDAHWPDNSKMAPLLLRYLMEHTAMRKVNFGGDIVNTEEASSRDDWDYIYEWRDMVKALPNHHSVRGNHDDDIPGLNTDKAIYAYLMAAEETQDIVRGGDFYYYIDDVNEKTRYLYLDTHMCTTLTNVGEPSAARFIVDALSNTQEGWHIVPIAHIWFLYDDYNVPTVGQIPDYCQQLFTIFDAYNARSSGTVAVAGDTISYDFTSSVGKIEFCIGGHTHVDMDFTTDGGIPVILTEADCYEFRSGYNPTAGTITEASVDAIVADYDAKKVSVIRIGRGSSREVSLVQQAGYTNILDTVGWVDNKRLSQSGGYSESTQDGVSLTGYIPIKKGDVLRFANMTITYTFATGYDQHLYFFNSNKVGYYHGHISDLDGDVGIITSVGETDSGGTTHWTQITFNGGTYSGTEFVDGYIRINAVKIDSTSIITINEEIV